MSELKTLKDIEKCTINQEIFRHDCREQKCQVTVSKEVRQAAIEWVKALEVQNENFAEQRPVRKDAPFDKIDPWHCYEAAEIVKHIFNLTEAELK